ncbi:MAG: hypothetical protein LC808_17635 [Actinobacteria bacterium]|nr:hypothetical protein [Actinomycetota bacterium]
MTYGGSVPEKHHPKPEERDERVSLPLPPEVAIPAILATGPHPDDADGSTEPAPNQPET